jgi:murein DD-endopeptidase MepM/ murein hydrolase activator NlpD
MLSINTNRSLVILFVTNACKQAISAISVGLILLLLLVAPVIADSGAFFSHQFAEVPLKISLETPQLRLKGELTQGALVIGKTLPGYTVMLDAQRLKVTIEGLFVMGFNRDAKPDHKLVISDDSGKHTEYQLEVTPRKYDIQYIEGIAKKLMQPNATDLQRIRAENAMIREARLFESDQLNFTEPFIWPAQGPVTGVYGSQRYYNGEPRRPHFGLDIAAPEGADVIAPASGTITLVHPDMFFSGGTIILDHGYGISSTFIHLSKVMVVKGQLVKQGQLLGKVGQSGRATGPHLDWRINWFNTRLDPALLLTIPEKSER